MYKITFMPSEISIDVPEGISILEAERLAGINADSPCGGKGTCGKCAVDIQKNNSTETHLACSYIIDSDLTVYLKQPEKSENKILSSFDFENQMLNPFGKEQFESDEISFGAAFDIGTTTVVCYLLDLKNERIAACESDMNPQSSFGADVISRCEYACAGGLFKLSELIRNKLNELAKKCLKKAGIDSFETLKLFCVVGNTCMHHLYLGINPESLTHIPFTPVKKEKMILDAKDYGFDCAEGTKLLMLPNIAGFVGADTVSCLVSTEFDRLSETTLMIDIGTNGEMVLGNKERMMCCSTAAGPAFEGAKIECGMRGADGAVDHVSIKDGKLDFHVIGDVKAKGICGSGLIDLAACALKLGIIDETGKISENNENIFIQKNTNNKCIFISEDVYLTQKDIRELQLAKAAISAGIEILAKSLSVRISDISSVLIAGAFGNYMNPESAFEIGLLPKEFNGKVRMIGNAAGAGACMALLNKDNFEYAGLLSEKTEFTELASHPDFEDIFVDNMYF